MIARAASVLIAALSWGGPALAECRLALLLAVDVSNSVDRREDVLQRNGLAAALLAPEVAQAVFASDFNVALAAYEWSGRHHQQILLDWTVLKTPEQLQSASDKIRASQRGQVDFPTAIGAALDFGAQMFGRAPDCLAQTLDMAGDGKNNDGFEASHAYANPAFDRITVNGLVVRVVELEMDPGIAAYYRSDIIRGAGSFVQVAQGFEDYERAMRQKLERELAPAMIGSLHQGSRG
ncbi:MAG: hypothetical protein ACI9PY_001646 [Ascidiaceihabitans sp.]